MKYDYLYSGQAKEKRNRYSGKKKAASLCFILLLIGLNLNKEPEDIIYRMTTYVLPVLTYESEYGEGYMDYASSYNMPDWFYEDESMPENGDIAAYDNGMNAQSTESNAVAGDAADGRDDSIETQGDENNADNSGNENSNEAAMNIINNKTKGTTYTRKQLSKPDFLTSRIFTVDSNTSMTAEELSVENLLDRDLSLQDLPRVSELQADDAAGNITGASMLHAEGEADTPVISARDGTGAVYNVDDLPYKVLIYHTHASESFADSRPGVKEDTVVGAGAYLTRLLNERYGIHTYHDETTYDVIDGQLDRSRAYEKSYEGISRILKDNPSIEVVIDLHRDGVDEETHLVTEVNGKPTAKIMFLNGVSRSNLNGEIDYLQNPNKLANLAFSFQLFLAGKEDYGDYVRKIYVRSLRYNLHVMSRATLIEAGAQNNTIEEEMNAMEPLAAMLDKVLRNQD